MERLLEIARQVADQCDIYYQARNRSNISFEDGRLKDISSDLLSGYYLRLFRDGKLGTAYTQNLIDREELVRNACAAMAGGVEGRFSLPQPQPLPALRTFDPALLELTNTQLVDEATRICQELAARITGQINLWLSREIREVRLLNSNGLNCQTTVSSYSCMVYALFPGSYSGIGRMLYQQGYQPFPDELIQFIARSYQQAERVVTPKGGRMKVLFMPEAAGALFWRLTEGTNAKNLYEKTSPLTGKLGTQVLSPLLTVRDEALNDMRPDARAFDDEGTPCQNLTLIENGVLRNFYCDRYYAAKTGIPPTGNGYKAEIATKVVPAAEHLVVQPGTHSFDELLKLINRGIIVAGAVGAHSGNILNGDYSIGVVPALWVEDGQIQGRVKDCMTAGNIYQTLQNVIALENQVHPGHLGFFPAILLDDVPVTIRS